MLSNNSFVNSEYDLSLDVNVVFHFTVLYLYLFIYLSIYILISVFFTVYPTVFLDGGHSCDRRKPTRAGKKPSRYRRVMLEDFLGSTVREEAHISWTLHKSDFCYICVRVW